MPQPTEAELAAMRAERERQDAERAACEARAEALLLSSITPRQASQYRRLKWFTVRGASGDQYRVRKGRVGNVDRIDAAGRVVDRWCAHPAEFVPDCDTMLAQALMLETDDAHFRRMANMHPPTADRVPAAELH